RQFGSASFRAPIERRLLVLNRATHDTSCDRANQGPSPSSSNTLVLRESKAVLTSREPDVAAVPGGWRLNAPVPAGSDTAPGIDKSPRGIPAPIVCRSG